MKLVSSIGIGTVACGVAKADADVIQISGGDGGTGASPLSSIKHAGGPWELGLTEAHSALVMNNLRDRVTLRVDGGVRTGRDVVMAALMGAEEFGFGTIAMIAEGCIMARVCHLNTCPVGVTSQKEELRKKFPGTPEHVVQFFQYAAMEVRELLAHLGYKSLDEVIGRCDLLAEDKINMNRVAKSKGIALSELYGEVPDVKENRAWLKGEGGVEKDSIVHINKFSSDLDRKVCKDAAKVIEDGVGEINLDYDILNTDRSAGAMLSGDIARKWGNKGFMGKINVNFKGSAGQSFGAFTLPGTNLKVTGEANDYVGKGMHGGSLTVVPPPSHQFDSCGSSIVGNACLYGATGGDFHANGRAGERFCVRNSGAYAVCEGTGDHCCEYMTGGVVVVLGTVGRNVGAGMTGGIGYFFDPDGQLDARVNKEIVKMQRVSTTAGEKQLRTMVERHVELTGSSQGKRILADWDSQVKNFWQVFPPSEKDSNLVKELDESGNVKISASYVDADECFLSFDSDGNIEKEELVSAYCAD